MIWVEPPRCFLKPGVLCHPQFLRETSLRGAVGKLGAILLGSLRF